MTRAELKEHCEQQIRACEMWAKARGEGFCEKVYAEHKLILELLEQEPCEDCISRYTVIDVLKHKWNMFSDANDAIQESIDTIEALPPVTPQTRKGHWIYKEFDERTGITNVHICSKCGYPLASSYKLFCSACGSDNRKVKE